MSEANEKDSVSVQDMILLIEIASRKAASVQLRRQQERKEATRRAQERRQANRDKFGRPLP